MRRRIFQGLISLVAITSLLMTNCGKKDDDDPVAAAVINPPTTGDQTSDVILSGALSIAASQINLTLVAYQVYCVTFEFPPVAGYGDVADDGSFSLTLVGAKDKAFGCFVRDGSTTVATLAFEDSSETGMNGSAKRSGSISLSGDASLGTIVLDLDKGIAVVDKAEITTTETEVAATEELFDFSGAWEFQAIPAENVPPGYGEPCAEGSTDCNGPTVGQTIYMMRLEGKAFEPDADCVAAREAEEPIVTCGGAATDEDVYGLMVWQSEAAYENCGSRLGVSYEDAKAYAQVDLTASGIGEGAFTWMSEYNSVAVTDGWKIANATASWDMANCYINEDTGMWVCDDQTMISSGSLCSSSSDELLEAKCYASFFSSNEGDLRNSGQCIRQTEFDWSATTLDGFLAESNDPKPMSLYVFEKAEYTSATSLSVRQIQETRRGIEINEGENHYWQPCRVLDDFSFSATKLSDTEMLMDFQTNMRNIDDDADCIAQAEDLKDESRYLLKMVKQ